MHIVNTQFHTKDLSTPPFGSTLPPRHFPNTSFQMHPRPSADLLVAESSNASDSLHDSPDIQLRIQLVYLVQFIPCLGSKKTCPVTHLLMARGRREIWTLQQGRMKDAY